MRFALISDSPVSGIQILLEQGDAEKVPQQVALATGKKIPLVPGQANQSVRKHYLGAREQQQLLERTRHRLGHESRRRVIPSVRENANGAGGFKTRNQDGCSGRRVQRMHEGRKRLGLTDSNYHFVDTG